MYRRGLKNSGVRLFIFCLVFVTLAVAAICVFFVSTLNRLSKHQTDLYLFEISAQLKNSIDIVTDIPLRNLENLSKETDLNSGELLSFLKTTQTLNGYFYLAASNTDGIGVDSDGNASDLRAYAGFERAMGGESHVSFADGLVVFFIPVSGGGDVTGVLCCKAEPEMFKCSLNADSFSGSGTAQITDLKGNIILFSENSGFKDVNILTAIDGNTTRNYSLESMAEHLQSGETGLIYYLIGGEEYITVYEPLGIEGLYLMKTVPKDAAFSGTEKATEITVLITVLIFCLFMLLVVTVIAMLLKNKAALEKIAFEDPVTNGPNKTKFEMHAKELISESPALTYAMVALDMDKFKLINDMFGSKYGNAILKNVYNAIKENLQEGELAARVSGDIFSILIKNTGQELIGKRIEELAEVINRFNESAQKKYFIYFTAGVYIIDKPKLNIIAVQDRANVARKSKKTGGKRALITCAFYSEVERMKLVREKEIDNRMEQALQGGEFVVYLQPKYDLKTDKIAGAEALIRWLDPQYGLISPGEFIPIFEKNGFIMNIDLFVFEKVCALLRKWMDEGKEPYPISVNLSRVNLSSSGFLDRFKDISTGYRVPPRLIEIELTETVVFEHLEALINITNRIHEIGYSCSLDDFGSGYSSLNMLKNIPADVIKIDRAFFSKKEEDDKRGRNVVESIISLSKKLNMVTVAEGVETSAQLEFLKKAKCEIVQGFIYSKPMPIEEFEVVAYQK